MRFILSLFIISCLSSSLAAKPKEAAKNLKPKETKTPASPKRKPGDKVQWNAIEWVVMGFYLAKYDELELELRQVSVEAEQQGDDTVVILIEYYDKSNWSPRQRQIFIREIDVFTKKLTDRVNVDGIKFVKKWEFSKAKKKIKRTKRKKDLIINLN